MPYKEVQPTRINTQLNNIIPTNTNAQYTQSPLTITNQNINAIPTTINTQYNIPQTTQPTTTNIQNPPPIANNIQIQTQPKAVKSPLNKIQIIQNATPAFPNMAQVLTQQKLNKTPMPILTPQQSADSHFVRNVQIYETSEPRLLQINSNKRSIF